MPDPAKPSTSFWRCESCGTPNPEASYLQSCLGCGRPRPARRTPTAPSQATRPGKSGPDAEDKAYADAPLGLKGWLVRVSLVYAGVVLLVLVVMRWVGDAWWGTTLLLVMPRYAWLAPVGILALAAGLGRSYRSLAILSATALVVAGPLMGLALPLPRLVERLPPGEKVRVATFNLGTEGVTVTPLDAWLTREGIGVVCLQEGDSRNDTFYNDLESRGWSVNKRRTIASRWPVVAELDSLPDESTQDGLYTAVLDRLRVRTPGGREVVVASVHLPTLRAGFEGILKGQVDPLTLHLSWWGRQMSRVLESLSRASDVPMLVGGDFNMPPDDSTMHSLRSSFRYAFDEAGWGYGYTRPAAHPWVRIDHLLASREWYVTACKVGPDLGSDHLPLVAEFLLPAKGKSQDLQRPR